MLERTQVEIRCTGAERGLDVENLGRAKNINGTFHQVLPFHTSGAHHHPHFEERDDSAYWSGVELDWLVLSRLATYSVFRSHVTVGTACDDVEPLAVESPSRYWPLGSSFGGFFSSGFSARNEREKDACGLSLRTYAGV